MAAAAASSSSSSSTSAGHNSNSNIHPVFCNVNLLARVASFASSSISRAVELSTVDSYWRDTVTNWSMRTFERLMETALSGPQFSDKYGGFLFLLAVRLHSTVWLLKVLVNFWSQWHCLGVLTKAKNERGQLALHVAVEHDSLHALEYLLGVDAFRRALVCGDRARSLALHAAARSDRTGAATQMLFDSAPPELLEEMNVPDAFNLRPLEAALQRKNLVSARVLITYFAPTNGSGTVISSIHAAVAADFSEGLEFLADFEDRQKENGEKVVLDWNRKDLGGCSPLLDAALGRKYQCLRFLLTHRSEEIDVTAKNAAGATVFELCANSSQSCPKDVLDLFALL